MVPPPTMLICRGKHGPGRSHSCSFDHRRRPDTLRTAMAITGGLLFGEILSALTSLRSHAAHFAGYCIPCYSLGESA